MLEHKLRRAGIEVTRMESRDEEDRREDARDERRKEDGTRSRGGAEGVSPPPSALPSSRRRRSISIGSFLRLLFLLSFLSPPSFFFPPSHILYRSERYLQEQQRDWTSDY